MTEQKNLESKQHFPIHPNGEKFSKKYLLLRNVQLKITEINGYMYPAYQNGYYNGGYYYYNGMPASRPPKLRRRKRFHGSKNFHQQPRSAETTTDYSDDENTTHNNHFEPQYQNGWSHYNGYSHLNGKFQRVYGDQSVSYFFQGDFEKSFII